MKWADPLPHQWFWRLFIFISIALIYCPPWVNAWIFGSIVAFQILMMLAVSIFSDRFLEWMDGGPRCGECCGKINKGQCRCRSYTAKPGPHPGEK